jgi:hypothetical protein
MEGIMAAIAGEVTTNIIWKVTNAARKRFLIVDIISYLLAFSLLIIRFATSVNRRMSGSEKFSIIEEWIVHARPLRTACTYFSGILYFC